MSAVDRRYLALGEKCLEVQYLFLTLNMDLDITPTPFMFAFLDEEKMIVTITSVRNPKWVNEEHTMIDCEITTSQFGNTVLPFTASQNDCEEHGRAIFAEIAAGAYGDIEEYVPPPPLPKTTATPSLSGIPSSVL
jgi:hypothetical protein